MSREAAAGAAGAALEPAAARSVEALRMRVDVLPGGRLMVGTRPDTGIGILVALLSIVPIGLAAAGIIPLVAGVVGLGVVALVVAATQLRRAWVVEQGALTYLLLIRGWRLLGQRSTPDQVFIRRGMWPDGDGSTDGVEVPLGRLRRNVRQVHNSRRGRGSVLDGSSGSLREPSPVAVEAPDDPGATLAGETDLVHCQPAIAELGRWMAQRLGVPLTVQTVEYVPEQLPVRFRK